MAERGGFEPPIRFNPYNGLANRRLQPLGHLSTGFSETRPCLTLKQIFHRLSRKQEWSPSILVGIVSFRLTPEVSDRRRQERWSARGTPELPPGVERRPRLAKRTVHLGASIWWRAWEANHGGGSLDRECFHKGGGGLTLTDQPSCQAARSYRTQLLAGSLNNIVSSVNNVIVWIKINAAGELREGCG